MIYYRVPARMDNRPRHKRATKSNLSHLVYNGIWIAHELYTLAELRKLGYTEPPDFLERVEISRRKIYWCFGARFTDETEVKTPC